MTEENAGIKRNLKTRHVSMIALGGSIGTGLFVASGATVAQAGPLGAIVAYLAIGVMVYFLMTSLGEMATYAPTSGSFSDYAGKYVDPALGFAMGWNYWFNWAITLAVDIVAVGLVTKFWFPNTPGWIFSSIALVLIFLINLFSVGAFGETEFWLSMIKVITIIAFLIIGIATIFGVIHSNIDVMKNLSVGNHGFVGGPQAILSVFVVAGFSFQGTELIGITAGEAKDPDKSVPKAINQVFWRILLFYILAIFVISALVYYQDSRLLSSSTENIAVSPFTIVFKNAGIAFAASLMNAVILTSIVSSANSGSYASTRMLYAMARKGDAPKIFSRLSTRGVPVFALILTTLIGLLAFISNTKGGSVAYTWLVNASGLTGFIAWVGIAISHYRFRRAYVAQGKDLNDLKYKAKWFPFGPIFALIISIGVIIGQDPASFTHLNLEKIAITYLSVPLFIVLFVWYKITHKTKMIKLEDVDLEQHR
ncbi:amino acid permease [Leuconostoc carnosum]|uniref:amino acid permease n=1 Tax=Leuconostoc TaxID=1243 RepID=UPI000D5099B7|nr:MULTISPECIES: amino acid permease [Leuconostoc]KAA8324419.1 amino acid permease [Leuconostoc carnosum]KAA8358091.1 amino acid permease [Leuconostoc carnosum]KAA8364589.1 amino acid permease [Leuconostoc carnosum]KAA8365463.1 amino acid permease [Leuconostoc carnosum]KAA8371493.1 amino acid permease [Leuconostoc carnosum]